MTNTTYITSILFTDITRTYSLDRLTSIETFYMPTNIRQNNDTSSSDMVTTVSRFRDRPKNIGQWRKSSSLKEKEIAAGTDCLETSLYNVLRFLNEKIFWLFCAVNVDTIHFASLTFPYSTRCREFLQKRKQSRDPFGRVDPWSWTIKKETFLWHSYFKMSFTLFISNLLTGQIHCI